MAVWDKSPGIEGGEETSNQRELKQFSIYWLIWATIFSALVGWYVVVSIISLVTHLVYEKKSQVFGKRIVRWPAHRS
jgi:hypothetical protein